MSLEESMQYLSLGTRSDDAVSAKAEQEWNLQKWHWIKAEDPTLYESEGYIQAQLVGDSGDSLTFKMPSGQSVTHKKDSELVQKMNPPRLDRADDMAELTHLNEASVLDNLRKRYYSNLIYTYSGLFCVVINPYKWLPIYSEEVMGMYRGRGRSENPPHLFNIADVAYRNMLGANEDQSILITGESGAGKTENTKKVIQYFSTIACSDDKNQLSEQMTMCNPLLEAFGNAKTVKNDNSSRFGKFIKIRFNRNGYLSGGVIDYYLLEKQRVVEQGHYERNFHIFYQLAKNADAGLRAELLLDDISSYAFISNKDASNDPAIDDKREWDATLAAAKILNFSDEDWKSLLRVVSAVMRMGQMLWKDNRDMQAVAEETTEISKCAQLLGISANDLQRALQKPKIKTGREEVVKAQSAKQVSLAQATIAKVMYEQLFKNIMKKVNSVLKDCPDRFIGILDIAGFEIFENNSFDQLCINFTNERLQQFFNHTMFIHEQEEYTREGIEWVFEDFGKDLEPQINLIGGTSSKALSILSLLDETCNTQQTDQIFVDKCIKNFESIPQFSKGGSKIKSDKIGFVIHHYAGSVEYNAFDWVNKNKDPLNMSVVSLLTESTHKIIADIFAEYKEVDTGRGRATTGVRSGSMRTISQLHRDNLQKLMNTLSSTKAHFVRCIIPNRNKKPGVIEAKLVLDQLSCNGVLEGIRICRKGYPNRVPFLDFKTRYEILCPNVLPKGGFMDGRKACEEMLDYMVKQEILRKEMFKVGMSKVFFRQKVMGILDELRAEKLNVLIKDIQAYAFGVLARRQYIRMTNHELAVKIIQRNLRKYIQVRGWPWWQLFTRVKPLFKAAEEDKVKRELADTMSKIKDLEDKERLLSDQLTTAEEQVKTYKDEISRLDSDISMLQDQLEAKTTDNNALSQEVQDLEKGLNEETAKAKALQLKLKDIESMRSQLETDLSISNDLKDKLEKDKVTLDDRIKTLSDELAIEKDNHAKTQKEKVTLHSQLQETTSALAATEDKLKTLQKKAARSDTENTDLVDSITALESERNALVADKRKLESDASNMSDRIAQLEKRVSELESEVEKMRKSISDLTSELESETTLREKLERELKTVQAELEDAQNDATAYQTEITKLRKEKSTLESRLSELEDSLESTSGDKQAVQKALQDIKNTKDTEITNLRNELSEIQALTEAAKRKQAGLVAELETDVADFKKKASDLEKKLKATQASLDESEENGSALESANHQLEKDLSAASNNYNESQSSLASISAKVSELESANTKLRSELASLTAQFEERDSEGSTLARDLKAAKLKIDELEGSYEEERKAKQSLQSKLRDVTSDSDAVKSELAEMEANLSAMELSNKSLNTVIADLKRKLSEKTAEEDEFELAKKKLASQLNEATEKAEDMAAQKAKIMNEKNRLTGEIDDLNSEMESLKSAFDEANRKRKKAEDAAKEANMTLSNLETELNSARNIAGQSQAKCLTLNSQLEDKVSEAEALSKKVKQLQTDIDDLANNRGASQKDIDTAMLKLRDYERRFSDKEQEVEELTDEVYQKDQELNSLRMRFAELTNQNTRMKDTAEEELESVKRSMKRTLAEVESRLEQEQQNTKTAITKAKLAEANAAEIANQLEEAEHSEREITSKLSKVQTELRNYQQETEEALSRSSDSEKRLKDAERKISKQAGELATVTSDMERANKARKALEIEKTDIQIELDTAKGQLNNVIEEKRRAQNDLDDVRNELDARNDEFDSITSEISKYKMEIESLSRQNAAAISNQERADQKIISLERANNELKEQVDDLAINMDKKYKTKISALESKQASLKADLDNELRRSSDATKKIKSLEKNNRDLQANYDELESKVGDIEGARDASTKKARSMTAQVEEIENDLSKEKLKSRRLQQSVYDLEEEKSQLEKKIQDLDRKLKGRVAGTRINRHDSTPSLDDE